MKDGLPWRERRRLKQHTLPAEPPPRQKKFPCYLVTITTDYTPEDKYGISSPYYIVNETQERKLWEDLAPGAMCIDDMGPRVKLPDGQTWYIDSRASNCTRPADKAHRCWVRHGEAPMLTVDKDGDTCQAGAGSIATRGYHGFLRNGFLVEC